LKKDLLLIKILLLWIIIINTNNIAFSQGANHNWLLGYNLGLDTFTTAQKARLGFDSISFTLTPESRKLPFLCAQATISDENGNLLISTNGCWIANSQNDTMLNGSGLNPGDFTDDWCDQFSGLPFPHTDVLLPWPDDTSKYVLLHETGNWDLNGMASELYYSIIDMSLDSGLGGVIAGQKNLIAIQDTLTQGFAICKHANGRDWWLVIGKDSTDLVYTILLTPTGISSINTQSLGLSPHNYFAGQPQFSNDGNKFAYHWVHDSLGSKAHEVRVFNFDRCTGFFSNATIITTIEPIDGVGLAFSPDSKYLYFSTFKKIFQLNTDTTDIQASMQMVALNDNYYSPTFPFQSDFWLMYLAANGKIYISSGNSVVDMHFINYPDSGGLACDVQQHSLHLPCYAARGDVLHPNYYLGPVIGSTCDSLPHVGINELNGHDFHFSVSPNPSNGDFKIAYLLPQNKHGWFEVYDVNGRRVFRMPLPQWSTLQLINLPNLSDGIYNAAIISGSERANRKIVVIKNFK
jgi:hypothetical protein